MEKTFHTLRAAAEHAGVSPETIRAWCRDHGIGRQAPGTSIWVIDRVKLEQKMKERTA
jgi:hypothetical protein